MSRPYSYAFSVPLWATVTRQVHETLRPGFEAVVDALDQQTEDAEFAQKMLAGFDRSLQLAREMEEIVAEEREQQQHQM